MRTTLCREVSKLCSMSVIFSLLLLRLELLFSLQTPLLSLSFGNPILFLNIDLHSTTTSAAVLPISILTHFDKI